MSQASHWLGWSGWSWRRLARAPGASTSRSAGRSITDSISPSASIVTRSSPLSRTMRRPSLSARTASARSAASRPVPVEPSAVEPSAVEPSAGTVTATAAPPSSSGWVAVPGGRCPGASTVITSVRGYGEALSTTGRSS
ncbi:hypothetical protein NKH77_39880 [Streptomyces sp. M19]